MICVYLGMNFRMQQSFPIKEGEYFWSQKNSSQIWPGNPSLSVWNNGWNSRERVSASRGTRILLWVSEHERLLARSRSLTALTHHFSVNFTWVSERELSLRIIFVNEQARAHARSLVARAHHFFKHCLALDFPLGLSSCWFLMTFKIVFHVILEFCSYFQWQRLFCHLT